MKTEEQAIVWIQGGGCTGCSVSLLNSRSPAIDNLIVDEVIPGKHLNLRFHPTVMAGQGEAVVKILKGTPDDAKGKFLLVVEGAVQEGKFCLLGEDSSGEMGFAESLGGLASSAACIIAVGTCSSFGGIPAGKPNPTACRSVGDFLKDKGIATPLVNVPGCPPHPDWFVGAVSRILLAGLPEKDELDDHLRMKAFYGELIHENCPKRASFDEGKFAKKLSEEGCLYELGCKGPITYADCPTRNWNSGVNWCMGAGGPCSGCTQPEFPDLVGPLYEKVPEGEIPRIGESWKGNTKK